ncbi:MAG: histidinol-phosphate transaminase [Sphingomonas sp.]|nr:histidinol-phosphate transaminase [Sphingomonas sp.]
MADISAPKMSRRGWLAGGGTALLAGAIGPGVAAAARPAGEPIRLNLNENAYGPSPRVGQAIAAHAQGIHRYVDQGEVDALTAQIAALEQVRPDQVVIGEVLEPLGLYLARQRASGAGGSGGIVYSTPGYTALVDAAAPLGGVAVGVPLNARLENDLPALARAVDDRTLAVNLVNPHNPSGTVNDRDQLDRFIRETARRTLVVIDEAYLEYDDFAAQSAIRHVREGANVLVFRTLAKIYGLAGLSIGYAVAPTPLAEGLRKAGIGAPHSLNRLALAAAGAALEDQRHIQDVRARTLAERARLTRALDELGLEHSDSRTNFVFFKSPRAAALRQHLAAAGIAIARPFPPLDDWIRITIGLPHENDAVIAALRGG